MATSREIRAYARENNISNADARAHFIQKSMSEKAESLKEERAKVTLKDFKPDAGNKMLELNDNTLVLSVADFINSQLANYKEHGGSLLNSVGGYIELNEIMGLSKDLQTDYFATLWFTRDMWDKMADCIEQGAQVLEFTGTPQPEEKAGGLGEMFRPIKVDDVNIRGVCSNAGAAFSVFTLYGQCNAGQFATMLRSIQKVTTQGNPFSS